MGEALLARGGSASGGGSNGSGNYELVTEIINENKQWTAPIALNQEFSVRIFGGGGAGLKPAASGYMAGGGGGYMNNGIFTINSGTLIPITIGTGGKGYGVGYWGVAGGTTSFGSYLSANGGDGGKTLLNCGAGGDGGAGGGGISGGGNGYQFGGGGLCDMFWSAIGVIAGDAGIWVKVVMVENGVVEVELIW